MPDNSETHLFNPLGETYLLKPLFNPLGETYVFESLDQIFASAFASSKYPPARLATLPAVARRVPNRRGMTIEDLDREAYNIRGEFCSLIQQEPLDLQGMEKLSRSLKKCEQELDLLVQRVRKCQRCATWFIGTKPKQQYHDSVCQKAAWAQRMTPDQREKRRLWFNQYQKKYKATNT